MGVLSRLAEFVGTRALKVAGKDLKDPALQIWFSGTQTKAGVNVSEATALNLSAVYAAINILSSTVASLPLFVYKRTGNKSEKAVTHPAYKLLKHRPNPYMTPSVFKQTLTGHVVSWGNGYAEIERNGAGDPIALWPIPPNVCEPRRDERNNSLYYEVTTGAGQKAIVRPDNMLHIYGLGFDGFKGYSILSLARESLGAAFAAEEFGARFYTNNATPSGFLVTEQKLGDRAVENLKKSFAVRHEGLTNAHRLAILEHGLKWQAVGIPPKDTQLLESRKFSVYEIARWFNIPPHMLRELDRATFSNIEQQSIDFIQTTMLPWFVKIEEACNARLLFPNQQDTHYTKFNANALLRGTTLDRYRAYNIGIMSGWLSPNEVRDLEDLNPFDQGDVFFRPLNMANTLEGNPNDKTAE